MDRRKNRTYVGTAAPRLPGRANLDSSMLTRLQTSERPAAEADFDLALAIWLKPYPDTDRALRRLVGLLKNADLYQGMPSGIP